MSFEYGMLTVVMLSGQQHRYLKVPVKAADVDAGGVPVVILHGGVVDDIDDRTNNCCPVPSDPVK